MTVSNRSAEQTVSNRSSRQTAAVSLIPVWESVLVVQDTYSIPSGTGETRDRVEVRNDGVLDIDGTLTVR